MLKSIFSIVMISVLLISSNPIANIMANKATDDEAKSQSVDLEEVFVSESGMLADGTDGSYVGIPSKSYEPGQTFEEITVNGSNKMKDVDGEEIGTYSDQLTGKVSEEEFAAPRALLHLRGTDDSAQQDIELNDFRAVVRSGAVLNSDGDYVWTAENSDSGHSFTYRIFYAFSGVGEYAEDQIHITIPKSILRDRDGNFADSYELPIPEYTEDDLTASNLFVYKEVGENLVIFNRLSCSAAQSGFIEVSYTTTKPTFDYADYLSEDTCNDKGGSDLFQAKIAIDNGSAHCSGETQKVPVYIDTTATLRKVEKLNPYSAYTAWNDAWGNTVKPDNPDDYEYLIWTINTEADATQPYNLTFSDTFNETDAELLGYRGAEGPYQRSLKITNSRSRYLTVYVLTAHKKSTYNDLLEQNGRYSLNNSVSVTLQPADMVDSTSTLTSRATYYKQAPRFEHPSGHFYSTKNGYDVSDRYVRNSDYIRDYSLLEFNGDDSATIGNLKYYTDVYGYAYPWTLPDGVTLDQAADDPDNCYGQKPVTYTLSDNTFYLKEISDEEYSEKLTANDYEFEKLTLYYYTMKATYDEESMDFDTQTFRFPDDVIDVYAKVGGNEEYIKIAVYTPFTGKYDFTDDAEGIVDKYKTGGTNLFFLGNVTGFRLETSNAHWYTKLGAYPYVKLKHSDTVDKYARSAIGENSVSKLCLKNTSASKISQSNRTIISFTRSADDYITGKNKSSLLEKSFVGATNSAKKREYTVTWNVSMSESYRDNESTYPIPQQSGVFYDLLPEGAVYKKDSLSVYAGSTKLESWKYTVTVDDNYRNSGRTMLKIAINESADSYRFVYSTVHPWEAIADYGTTLLNTVAYETGNSSITDGKTSSQTPDIKEAELMRDLDQSGDSKRFLYTEHNHDASLLVATNLGLEKKVRGTDDTSYSQSAVTYNDNNYYYNVRFATDDHSKASKLIAFDSLENYKVVSGKDAGKTSEWRGIFQSVDTHQLERLGIAPKVYYSTVSGLVIDEAHKDLSDTSVWTRSDSFAGDLSSVKAIAVDMRTAKDGTPYEMPVNTGAQFTVYMRAPHGIDSNEITPRAFNNIYLNNNTINVETGSESGERIIHQDYTEITLKIVADLELLKVSSEDHNVVVPGIKFNLSGTSVYGTKVNETLYTDETGRITRRNLERGTYTLKETETNSDFFLNDTVFTVTVDKNGDLTINGSTEVKPYVIENPPRVHGDLEFLKKGMIDGTTDTAPLTGAEFKLEGVSNYGNSVLKYGTSQNGGVVTITDIEWGTYKLTETKTADGYIISTEEYSVVCDKYGIVTLYQIEDGSPVEVKPTENGYSVILNEPLHNFRLVKYDPLNNALLSGAEFTLKGTSDYGTPVDKTETSGASGSEKGIVFFKGLEPGHYTLQETKAPERYQLDPTVRTVTVSSAGEITVSGLTKRPSDWHSGFYTDCFGVPNTRAYEGEITITKQWLDADGNPITDSSDLPIPVVHVDTSEPKIDLPPQDAYLANNNTFRNSLSGATTFKKTQEESYTISTLPEGAVKVDDGTTRASIFVWKEGADAYWWSDAATAHLPDNSRDLFWDYTLSLVSVDLSGFDTSNVTNMSGMFYWCSNLTTLNLSGWDTGRVTTMNSMFDSCSSLTSLNLSGWDTVSVTNMGYMFRECSNLTNLKLSGWETGSVTNMYSMFYNCRNLTNLDLSGWDTGRVTDMNSMFDGCSSLTSLDLSGWDTGSVTSMYYMFYNCSNLKTVYVGDLWSTEKVTDSDHMFSYCTELVGGAGTTYDQSYTDKTYARVDNLPDAPGYFTYKEYVPPTGNKDDEPVGATLNNVLGGLINNKLVSAVFGDSSAENSQAAPEIQTVKKPEMLAAGRPDISAAIDFKSDIALGDPGDSDTNTNTNTVTFSQITNSEVTRNSDDAEGKWLDNGDGTWTYKMKVFNVPATYYIWEEPIPGFKCDLDNSTGYTVINYPKQNSATITNTRTTTNTCSLTLKKVLTGNASDYPEYDLAGMDYHFNVKLTGEGLAGEKVFGYTKFNNGTADVTLKAGEQITFTNIPRGVTYTVTEREENYQGVIDTTYSPSGTLTEDNSDVTFTVTNNIKPKKSFDITKHVLPYENGELDAEDLDRVFTFNVNLHEDINGLFGDLIFTGGTATAYLKHDETVSITGLPGTVETYTVTEAENSLYTCDKPEQSGTLTVGETAHVVFNNKKIPETERETGSFTLKKLINGKTTTDNEFAFNIAMSKLDKNAVYTLSDGTQFTTDQNGTVNLTLTLKHGDSVTFSDLPVGAEYTVSEQACNYTASYAITGTERVVPLSAENTETDKQLTTSKITVQKDDDITITYTNTDKRYDVRIAKVDEDDEFVTDAVLQIIEKGNEENVLDEWVTTEDYHTAQIPQGTYILREKQAPFGYMKAPDIEFTVNADGTITSGGENVLMLKMVDKPVELAVTGAGGVIPVAALASITFVILLAAVVIKNRKNNIKEKRSTTK